MYVAPWRFLWCIQFEMCPTFISHICSLKSIDIEISSMHSNYSNLSFYRNTLIDSSIWWMCPIGVEKFETTGKMRLQQILHDGHDSFTTDIAWRARFSDKILARRARFLLRFTQSELKSFRHRARYFYNKFSTTRKIFLRPFYPIWVEKIDTKGKILLLQTSRTYTAKRDEEKKEKRDVILKPFPINFSFFNLTGRARFLSWKIWWDGQDLFSNIWRDGEDFFSKIGVTGKIFFS